MTPTVSLPPAGDVASDGGDGLDEYAAVDDRVEACPTGDVPPDAFPPTRDKLADCPPGDWLSDWLGPGRIRSTGQAILGLAVLSLAPAILLMTTSFIRIAVVLGILRQAIGLQQLPSTQVISSLAIFLSVLIMTPVWQQVYREAIVPYSESVAAAGESAGEPAWELLWERGSAPVKRFMSRQIDGAGNGDSVWMFYQYLPADQRQVTPQSYEDVPLQVLLPAFVVSELKVAFMIGFQIWLPFVVLEMIVSSVLASMGMQNVPASSFSLPLKLVLFVMLDGWTLVVRMVLNSFVPGTG